MPRATWHKIVPESISSTGFMMIPSSLSTSSPSHFPKQGIPYSSAALRQDLERVRTAWDDCQANRDRNAIYMGT
jgi:hypothetical protein